MIIYPILNSNCIIAGIVAFGVILLAVIMIPKVLRHKKRMETSESNQEKDVTVTPTDKTT